MDSHWNAILTHATDLNPLRRKNKNVEKLLIRSDE